MWSSTRPTLTTYGRSPMPSTSAPGPTAAGRLAHPEAEHDLRAVGHRVDPLDQPAFGHGVVAEGVGAGVGAPEDRQVERRLVVGRRVQHAGHRDPADAVDRRVVEVGVEGGDVGRQLSHTASTSVRDHRAVELHPAFGTGVGWPRPGRSAAGRRARRSPSCARPPTRSGGPVTPLSVLSPGGSTSSQVRWSSAQVENTSTSQPQSATRCSASWRAAVSAPPITSSP